MRDGWTRRIAEGAGAGALATLPMTMVMIGAQRAGLLGEPPPAKITDALLDALPGDESSSERRMWTGLTHVGFGAATGAVFALLGPGGWPAARAALAGVGFGTAVWAISYAGWVPRFGIMPPPHQDRPGRPASMIAAHWVFGAALGLLLARLGR
jgi:hypothetical protein